ncbi:hypothetical protein ccbrp13_63230 [Ktedonobacteria bacterium brp13]|nr:hypothetical protein ccbrp13_63230 [Ktedonobacteria bacterium brp13]
MFELGITLVREQQEKRAEVVWTQVEKQIRALKGWNQRAEVLAKLAQALAQVQLWEKAEKIVISIDEWVYRAEAQRDLSQSLAQMQQWKQAENLARSIDISEERAKALIKLGKYLALHQQERWEETIGEAYRVTCSIWGDWERARTLCILSMTLAQIQQWKWVEEIVYSIHINRWKAEALGELGKVLALHQHWQWAKNVWTAAEAAACSIKELQKAGEYKRLLRMVQYMWLNTDTRIYTINLLPPVSRPGGDAPAELPGAQ